MRFFYLIAVFSFLFFCFPVRAETDGRTDFYNELAALHRTAFVLDYILQPTNFVHACYTLHGDRLPALSEEQKATLVKKLKKIMTPLSHAVKENEKSEVLTLINDFYLKVNKDQKVDYKRFFTVYRDKVQKSRDFIEQDLLTKEPVFLSFLQVAQIPSENYCQNKLNDDKVDTLRSAWPSSAEALREEIDAMLSGASQALPQIYQRSYRRLLK